MDGSWREVQPFRLVLVSCCAGKADPALPEARALPEPCPSPAPFSLANFTAVRWIAHVPAVAS